MENLVVQTDYSIELVEREANWTQKPNLLSVLYFKIITIGLHALTFRL